MVLRELKVLRLYTAVIAWWVVLFLLIVFESLVDYGREIAVFLAALPIVVMALKKRSLAIGFYSLVSWNVYTLGMLRGFFDQQSFPSDRIDAETVTYDGNGINKQDSK